MTRRDVAVFVAGLLAGLALDRGCTGEEVARYRDALVLERKACAAELRLCGAAGVESAVDAHGQHDVELRRCMAANEEIAAVLHRVVLQHNGCRAFLRLAAPRPIP